MCSLVILSMLGILLLMGGMIIILYQHESYYCEKYNTNEFCDFRRTKHFMNTIDTAWNGIITALWNSAIEIFGILETAYRKIIKYHF